MNQDHPAVTATTLVDPDCRDRKHAACAGGPCQCPCHMSDDTGDRLIVAADIVARHRPILFSATGQVYVCGACSSRYEMVTWPCVLRAEVGTLIDDPSNRLLPFGPPYPADDHPEAAS